MPSVTAAMRAMPPERPSSPSMKFMAFCMPRTQKRVRASPITSGIKRSPAPNGFDMIAIRTPKAIGTAEITSCPASCQRARRSKRSSARPMMPASRVPKRSAAIPDVGSGDPPVRPSGAARIVTSEPTKKKESATAKPPARGINVVLMRRSFGASARLNVTANRRTNSVPTWATTEARAATKRYGSAR